MDSVVMNGKIRVDLPRRVGKAGANKDEGEARLDFPPLKLVDVRWAGLFQLDEHQGAG